jgi:hypothetical protein
MGRARERLANCQQCPNKSAPTPVPKPLHGTGVWENYGLSEQDNTGGKLAACKLSDSSSQEAYRPAVAERLLGIL